jgi:DNA-binding transcriptional LysR family regulator
MDLDLRKLRYFVAVAERGNFGRAAEALHITQPVLSRQIRALEHELKASLFVRDSRGARLTAAGETLLAEARAVLPAAEAAQRRVRDAAAGVRRFTVGFTPGVPVAPAIREFARRHADVPVEVLRMDWSDRADIIRDGRADVGYLRLPADTTGLAVEPLLSEPRVVMVPVGHRLAGKDAVRIADTGEDIIRTPNDAPEWHDVAAVARNKPHDGHELPDPVARSIEELLEQVAAGRGVVVLPLSAALYFSRPDMTHVPVSDVAPAQVCLAWGRSRRSALIWEYLDIARVMAGWPTEAERRTHPAPGHRDRLNRERS